MTSRQAYALTGHQSTPQDHPTPVVPDMLVCGNCHGAGCRHCRGTGEVPEDLPRCDDCSEAYRAPDAVRVRDWQGAESTICPTCWAACQADPDGTGNCERVDGPDADVIDVLAEAQAIVGHGGPMTPAELSAALRERRLREHEAAHARWAARQAAERAAIEAEYDAYTESALHGIMVSHALHGTMFRDAAAAVLHRRQQAARRVAVGEAVTA